MAVSYLGKVLVLIGVGLAIAGLILWGLSKVGGPIGKLPGDIKIEGEKFSFYFPIITCIALSVILTLLINFLLWLFRK